MNSIISKSTTSGTLATPISVSSKQPGDNQLQNVHLPNNNHNPQNNPRLPPSQGQRNHAQAAQNASVYHAQAAQNASVFLQQTDRDIDCAKAMQMAMQCAQCACEIKQDSASGQKGSQYFIDLTWRLLQRASSNASSEEQENIEKLLNDNQLSLTPSKQAIAKEANNHFLKSIENQLEFIKSENPPAPNNYTFSKFPFENDFNKAIFWANQAFSLQELLLKLCSSNSASRNLKTTDQSYLLASTILQAIKEKTKSFQKKKEDILNEFNNNKFFFKHKDRFVEFKQEIERIELKVQTQQEMIENEYPQFFSDLEAVNQPSNSNAAQPVGETSLQPKVKQEIELKVEKEKNYLSKQMRNYLSSVHRTETQRNLNEIKTKIKYWEKQEKTQDAEEILSILNKHLEYYTKEALKQNAPKILNQTKANFKEIDAELEAIKSDEPQDFALRIKLTLEMAEAVVLLKTTRDQLARLPIRDKDTLKKFDETIEIYSKNSWGILDKMAIQSNIHQSVDFDQALGKAFNEVAEMFANNDIQRTQPSKDTTQQWVESFKN